MKKTIVIVGLLGLLVLIPFICWAETTSTANPSSTSSPSKETSQKVTAEESEKPPQGETPEKLKEETQAEKIEEPRTTAEDTAPEKAVKEIPETPQKETPEKPTEAVQEELPEKTKEIVEEGKPLEEPTETVPDVTQEEKLEEPKETMPEEIVEEPQKPAKEEVPEEPTEAVPDTTQQEKIETTETELPEEIPEEEERKKFLLSFGLSLDVESGDMTYTIQGPEDGGWKSELEWPLDNILYVSGLVSVGFFEKWQANVELWKSVTDDAGTMRDGDWFYGYYGDQTVVYSEIDTTVDAFQADLNLRYNFIQKDRLAFGGILGYAYKRWDWEGGDGYQWTIDPYSFYMGPINGPSITYKQDINVPYLGLVFSIFSANSTLGANLYTLYSPIAKSEDETDHLLRGKLGQGETDGTFFSLKGDVRWNLSSRWSLTARANFTRFDLDGKQRQYFYGGDNAGTSADNIDMTVQGEQTYLGLKVEYTL